MKFQLPLTSRYVFPLALVLLVLDLAVAAGVGWVLYRHADSVRAQQVDGMTCRIYSPTVAGDLYILARCARKDPA